ncbi:MAG TPA: phosphoenolpyruvate--protein phosphotransferase [Hungateiclostridium thermocellum]|jgi:phosphotransferase system enzyme I (PtsI)|nr:phosphoenolpyruvate--protein phosphotransferase [Acetivibrio thermocellus]ADU73416.1 phosphoenolpyruvate-protein phosphotransferase [Acetivibrio thermocellus DSM 1313]ALX07338.1 phosphoenolpyruvate-protein phosphotransferase [Acetivibrio thermocellus AD2]ANV75076.1 phosphoenolpyruvate-protein phosphotransferase [Acetivibrio thermocellus DSM 2360]EIC04195.1 phosphoenolpyruvate-protein phosphotransferase [Acetivibrio thermocellus YS]PFH01602.1 phosphoenolpyruvate--protein phosphotransferase [
MERKCFEGEPVSAGTKMGKIFIVKESDIKINEGLIDESEVEDQITNLEVAICRTFIEIYDLNDGFKGILSEEENRIFEFYKEILDDQTFFEEIKSLIKNERYSAEKAIYTCINKYIDEISKSNNEYIKQRIFDLNDIAKRLVRNISVSVADENGLKINEINSEQIMVLKELTPIIAASLAKKEVKGVVAEEGAGYFTHASIILRSTGIPAVNGIRMDEIEKFDGSPAIIDGSKGVVVANPSEAEIQDLKSGLSEKKQALKNGRNGAAACERKPVETADGYRIRLLANISSVKEFLVAKKLGVDGIGLVRTESLFINYKRIPDEKRQYLIYSKIAKDLDGKPVVIRTADIGGDKVPQALAINDQSLSRSARGIRRSLEHKTELVTQIRAIMRAGKFGKVFISFPMVDSIEQIMEVKRIIKDISDELAEKKGEPVNRIGIGTMVETAEAVKIIDEILNEVDFISIGTNDMLHQICEQSRKCSTLEMRSYLEPVFLQTLKHCLDKAAEKNKPACVCGEMATDPMAIVVLLGMGAKDLSMSPSYIENTCRFIRTIKLDEAKEAAQKALESQNLQEVKNMLSELTKNRM